MSSPDQHDSPPGPPDGWPWGDNWVDLSTVAARFSDYGGLLQSTFEDFFEALTQGTSWWDPPEFLRTCQYGLTLGCAPPAAAAKSKTGQYAVAVDVLAAWQLVDVFGQLLSHPGVLADIAPLRAGDTRPRRLTRLTPWREPDEPPEEIVSGIERPSGWAEESSRHVLLLFLVARALQFLCWHEVGHIHGGDLDYRVVKGSDVSFAWSRGSEHRADAFAVLEALHLEAANGVGADRDRHSILDRWVFLLGFSYGAWFHLVESFVDHDSPYGAGQATHDRRYPRGATRSYWARSAPAGAADESYGDYSREAVLTDLHEGFEEARHAWAIVGWGEHPYPTHDDINLALSDVETCAAATRPPGS